MSFTLYERIARLTLILTFLLIVIGGATRVYDAGMACPDWPKCYGLWWPWPEARVIEAGHTLGYWVQGQHYSWWQVLLEWGHRGLAAIVGGGLLALVVGWFRLPAAGREALVRPMILSVVLLIVQVKLGAVTVWLSNIHWSVAIHLGNAMLFFAALAWLRRVAAVQALMAVPLQVSAKASTKANAKASGKAAKQVSTTAAATPVPWQAWAVAGLFALMVWQVMLIGAFVSSSHAGGVCGGLFSCAGEWMPADRAQLWHMKHRYMALVVVALSVLLLVVIKRKAPQARGAALHAHLMIWGQVALGILTLYSFGSYPEFYYPLSIAHLAWGTLLWLGAIGVLLTLAYGNHGRFHGTK